MREFVTQADDPAKMAKPGGGDKLLVKNRDNLASGLIARQLHLGRHCVYVADETVFAGLSSSRLIGRIDDPDAYHGNAAGPGRRRASAWASGITMVRVW